MRLLHKIWLDNCGKAFGSGPCELLLRVEKTGSLRRAAIELGMSYNKAWRLINILEKRLGFPLLVRKAGGANGGGSEITGYARELIARYKSFSEEAGVLLEELYKKHFSEYLRSGE